MNESGEEGVQKVEDLESWLFDDLFEVKGRSTSRLYGFVLFDAESGSLECSQAGLADGDSHEGVSNQRVNICEMRG